MEATDERPNTEPMLNDGDQVFTSDGERFGRICDTSGGYFAIELPGGHGFWLSTRYLDHAGDGEVHLNVTASQAEEHRLSAPGIEHEGSGSGDRVIGDDEALDQRERMERELAEQRERMERERAATA